MQAPAQAAYRVIARHLTLARLLSSRIFTISLCCAEVYDFSLQYLMGHADLQVLRRYLAQTTDDRAQAHRIGSPVDNNRL